MKNRLLLLIAFIAAGFAASAQMTKQSLGGSANVRSYVKGTIEGDSGIVVKTFFDTSVANFGKNLKLTHGLMIWNGDELYIRDTLLHRWKTFKDWSVFHPDTVIYKKPLYVKQKEISGAAHDSVLAETHYVSADQYNLVFVNGDGSIIDEIQFEGDGSSGGGSGGGTAGWGLTGNAGTNPATNFIGTTDNVDLVFKRFNVRAGFISKLITSFGDSALISATGAGNSAFGTRALAFNITGINNTAVGAYSLYTNTGSSNSAFGYGALYSNTTGATNLAVGSTALFSNTTGSSNSAFGSGTLSRNISGNFNTGFGNNALFNNTTGVSNAGVGYYTLFSNVSGNDNTGVGVSALRGMKTGSQNTAVGREALWTDSFAINNTAIGWRAGYNNRGSNNVLLGSQAGYNETLSNKLYVSNSATATPLIYGDFATGGLVLSPVTGALMNAIPTPRSGTIVYNTDSLAYCYFNGTAWVKIAGSGGGGSGSSGWGLTGNSGTDTVTSFVGTTDDKDIVFRRNSIRAGHIGTYNTSFGNKALSKSSWAASATAFGVDALAANVTGQRNAAFGNGSLAANTASNNSAFGSGSLNLNTTGSGNAAFGNGTLTTNLIGANNSAFGSSALRFVKGDNSSAFGAQALYNNNGPANTAIGSQTLFSNLNGGYNTVLGAFSGSGALGSGNVFVGYESGFDAVGDNQLYIANTRTATPLIYGDFSNGGLVLSPVSNSQMTSIPAPRSGTMVYNTDLLAYYYHNGTAWTKVGLTSGVDRTNGGTVASASTITATGNLFHVSGTKGITSISGTSINAGSTITVIFDGALTVTDGSNLKLAGNLRTTAGSTLTLTYDGTNFYEVARSIN